MAIDLFCFYKQEPDEVNIILNRMKTEHPEIFPDKYSFQEADPPTEGSIYLASLENFYDVKTSNIIWLMDKENFEILPEEIAELLRTYFRPEDILITCNDIKI